MIGPHVFSLQLFFFSCSSFSLILQASLSISQLPVSSYANPGVIAFLDSPVSILGTLMTITDRHDRKAAVS